MFKTIVKRGRYYAHVLKVLIIQYTLFINVIYPNNTNISSCSLFLNEASKGSVTIIVTILYQNLLEQSTHTLAVSGCPPGAHTTTIGNVTSCYTFHVTPRSWYDAAAVCKSEAPNSHLVSVNSKLEQDFLVDVIQITPCKNFIFIKMSKYM